MTCPCTYPRKSSTFSASTPTVGTPRSRLTNRSTTWSTCTRGETRGTEGSSTHRRTGTISPTRAFSTYSFGSSETSSAAAGCSAFWPLITTAKAPPRRKNLRRLTSPMPCSRVPPRSSSRSSRRGPPGGTGGTALPRMGRKTRPQRFLRRLVSPGHSRATRRDARCAPRRGPRGTPWTARSRTKRRSRFCCGG